MKIFIGFVLFLVIGFVSYIAYVQTRPIQFIIRDDIITISGNSMDPSLPNGQQYQVNLCRAGECKYNFQRGDIIVYRQAPRDIEAIKRIVGLPTEKVTITGGNVFINDQLLSEPYLASESSTILKDQVCLTITLKDDEYFVLGDNRVESHDSREDGPIHHASILSYLTMESINPQTTLTLTPSPFPSCP